jgi:L-iditol 2-dehydrogenase
LLANIIIKPGRIELCEIKTPQPSHGEMLIKIKAALTCGTDLKAFRRGHPMIPMPGVFGHEFSGVVAEVGKGVKGFKEGDEIMAVHTAPCLKCIYCKKRLYNLCDKIMDTKVLGAFAEYILLTEYIVKQNVLYKPKNLSFEEAAFLEPLSCVVHSMKSVDIKRGDNVLVIGAGPIGLLHLLLLKEKGATVTIIDKHTKKLKIAKNLGADFILRPDTTNSPSPTPLPSYLLTDLPSREENNEGKNPSPLVGKPARQIRSDGGRGEGFFQTNKFTDGIGFDYLFECTGRPEVWQASVNYVRRGGTVILFGGCKSGTKVTYDTGKLHYDEVTLKGVFHFTPSDVKKAYKLLCKGRIGISRLISGSYPLNQLQKAFDKLASGVGIKYAIIP